MKLKHLMTWALLLGVTTMHAQEITFYTPNTVRVVKKPKELLSNQLTNNDKQSLVVIANPENVKVKKTQKGSATVYASSSLTVTVDNGKVSFADNKGRLIAKEGNDWGFKPITQGPDKGASIVRQSFAVDADEGIYGVGLLQNGKMSQRGENRRMEQSNLEDYAHFFQSIKGYGIYWDNYSPTRFISPGEGQAGEVVLESEVGKMVDYYFLYGGDADGVIAEMRHLSGKVPMFPLWTYGFHQCRERYK